ncbi:MAG TPA: Stk1 family PASTA domain-containing Ser/Thr kinase [Gaiellaceae bacterium]
MAVSDTLIDTLFDGRYRIVRKLGTGGMAAVYLAEDQELGRRVAIKILDERHASDEQFVERFRREAKNAAALSHPNIVSIYDRGEAEGTYYIAMEYLDGRTLKELLVRFGTPPVRIAVGYVRQILAGLAFAHKHGLVHRDIKPHNVLVDSGGHVKVTDFGIARSGTSQMTEAGSIIGTAQYLSPEQARGAPVDQRSDIYSVGVLLYELLTGSVPFTGDTPVEIAMKHLSAVPQPPSKKRPDVGRGLDLAVVRALAKDPDERYQTAEEMDAELARIEQGLRVSDETADAATAVLSGSGIDTTAVRRAPVVTSGAYRRPPYVGYEEPMRKRPRWPWLLALLLLVAAGVGGWYAYTKLQDQLGASKLVSVPFVESQVERLAVQNIDDAGLRAKVIRRHNADVTKGKVYDQDPGGGEKIPRGNLVTIYVSQGLPQVTVPDLVGRSESEAKSLLQAQHLRYDQHSVPNNQPEGTVVAQDPGAGARVKQNTVVRINVSSGPQLVGVPSVVGRSYADALGELQGLGFAVRRIDVQSNEPAETVTNQDPAPNSAQPKGSTVTLKVSRGPSTTAIPDVRGLDQDTATATLRSAGFQVSVQQTDTVDPAEDGIVLSQIPHAGKQADVGSTVTITVGVLVQQPTETTPTTPTETTTTSVSP